MFASACKPHSLKHSLFLRDRQTGYDIYHNMINCGAIFTKSLLEYIHTFLKKELQAGGWISYSILNKLKT